MQYAVCETKLGWVGVGLEDGVVCATTLPTSRDAAERAMLYRGATEPAGDESAQLVELVRRAVEGEPVELKGKVRISEGTQFQRDVWSALLAIPRGATVSYADVARQIGRPGAARAVGQAVGSNPVPILIPCHRVLASGGGLGGFGGGLPMKEALLRQEGVAV